MEIIIIIIIIPVHDWFLYDNGLRHERVNCNIYNAVLQMHFWIILLSLYFASNSSHLSHSHSSRLDIQLPWQIIFCNLITREIISANLTVTIYDHLPQLLITPEFFWDWSWFKRKDFVLQKNLNFCNNWAEPWKTEQEYVHYSTEPY